MSLRDPLYAVVFAAGLYLLPAGQAAALRIAVISDLNGSYGATRYAPRVAAAIGAIVALDPDLVISTGDMVAGQRRPRLSETEIRAMWRAFHAVVSDPLERAGIPLAVTPGNHDASGYDGFEWERRIYAEEWRARQPKLDFVEGADYPFFYAFDLGGVRFVSLDVTTIGPLDPAQMAALHSAMTSAPAARVVFSHLPLWPFATGRETEIIGDPALETLFAELGIDIHLSGHHHAFFAGALGNVAVVSQACLGAGPRAWLGHSSRSDHAITLLDIDASGNVVVRAFEGPGFRRLLDIEALPRAIQSHGRTIKRLDLAPTSGVTWNARQ